MTNTMTKADFLSRVAVLGDESGMGKDAWPKFAMEICLATHAGAISPRTIAEHAKANEPNRTDEVREAVELFVQRENKKKLHDRDAAAQDVIVSKLRAVARLGTDARVDGPDILNRAFAIRANKPEANFDAAFASYVKVARAQARATAPLSDEEIEAAMLKAEPKDKDVIDDLERAKKLLETIYNGKEDGSRQCKDERVMQAAGLLGDVIKTIDDLNELKKSEEAAERAAALEAFRKAKAEAEEKAKAEAEAAEKAEADRLAAVKADAEATAAKRDRRAKAEAEAA